VRTSTARGVPETGKVLSLSFCSGIRLVGSTSVRMVKPEWTSEAGILTFQVLPSRPSSRAVGTPPAGAGMVMVIASTPASYSRARTVGAAVLAALARTNTRR
jgi:hypothetical protein